MRRGVGVCVRALSTWDLKAWVVVAALARSNAIANSRSSLATFPAASVLLPHHDLATACHSFTYVTPSLSLTCHSFTYT